MSSEILDTFLSLLSPTTVIGAVIFSADGKKAIQPINVHTVMVLITWVTELAALFMSYLMFSNLYDKSQKKDDDYILHANAWMYFARFIFVGVVVFINLLGGVSMETSKFIQNTFCGGTYYSNQSKSYKGNMLKYIYAAIEILMYLLPLSLSFFMVDRLEKYKGVCDGEELDWDIALKNKEYNLGQYYGWGITFYLISIAVRLFRTLVFGLIYGTEKNNVISHPSFTSATSMLQVNTYLRDIDNNMKMEKSILKNARYEVTYDLTQNKRADLQY